MIAPFPACCRHNRTGLLGPVRFRVSAPMGGHRHDPPQGSGAQPRSSHRVALRHSGDGVLRRLDRALARHLRQEHPASAAEEFVTLLLVEIRPDGEMLALNCGHPWPYLLSGVRAEQLAPIDPHPPLGLFPLPPVLPTVGLGRLEPGDALFLFTDGAQDARDARGRFFPLATALSNAVAEGPLFSQAVVGRISTALRHHTRGTPPDDIALLVLRNGRPAHLGARGTARTATTSPQPATHP
ncbi:PP2C family protein-serine/threonine phosphatase [Streptomyces massasporeus]|uniref:PP2C family protein-serine/threonine phosphatase n=1 Tax=Streptomyces massasporeus TaxID=67324 RepID=UPI0033E30A94